MSAIPDTADTSNGLHEGVTATTREVYPTSEGTVIKVPQKERYIDVNEREVSLWERYGDDRLMAPIVDYASDYEWIEMEMCRRLDHYKDSHLRQAFESKMADFDIHISDLHMGNLGILPSNRELVCYDYAVTA